MPNYEYECKECGHRFDKLLSVAKRFEPRKWVCPNCKQGDCLDMKITMPNVSYSDFGSKQPPSDVQQRLKDIGKNYKKITGHEMERKFGHNYLG